MGASKSTAVAYLRTSSLTNVGADKDSDKRQRDAINAYATAHGLTIVREFYDAGVSGADAVTERDGFNQMLAYLLGNGARIVLVENASRFARDLIVQLTGHDLLKQHGIELVPVDAPTHFTDDTPTARMVREILGAVAAFERNSLVARLKKGRDRRRREDPNYREGNPNIASLAVPVPETHVKAARAAHARGLSLRKVGAELFVKGFLNQSGKMYHPESIKSMLAE